MFGFFELMNGKTVLSHFEEIVDEGGTGDVIQYNLEKPILMMPMQDQQGRHGFQLMPYNIRILFPHGIIGVNFDNIDQQTQEQYIKATTGIQIAHAKVGKN